MNVEVSNRQEDLPLGEDNITDIVSEVITFEKQSADEVSINFITREEISRLHDQYFNDPSPTDCISFPIDGADESHYRLLGEVFICPQAAIDHGGDPYEETTLYLVHGLLHLMGYDDIDPSDEKEMRAAESRHMDQLQAKKLILHPPRR